MNLFVGKNSFCYTGCVVLPFKTAGWRDSVFVTPVLEGKYNGTDMTGKKLSVFVTPVVEGKYNFPMPWVRQYSVFVTPVLEGKYNLKTAPETAASFGG